MLTVKLTKTRSNLPQGIALEVQEDADFVLEGRDEFGLRQDHSFLG